MDRFAATGELIAFSGGGAGAANACFTCHGLGGEGNGAFTPRLADLDSGYLERQLIAYADGRRVHPQMGFIAQRLSARERRAVSAYYAALPAPPAVESSQTPRAAAALYHLGDPARGLPSCASCHGARGQGLGPAYPPLAGQPQGYLAAQFDHWRRSSRRTDPYDVMLRISQLLSPAEGAALAAYAAALPGGPPGAGSPATSGAARPGDPGRGAPALPLHVPESARAAR